MRGTNRHNHNHNDDNDDDNDNITNTCTQPPFVDSRLPPTLSTHRMKRKMKRGMAGGI